MSGPPPIRIPLAKPFVGEEEKRAVMEVLDSGQLAEGPRTRAFEELVAKEAGAKHAVAVANGTAALHLALLAAGVSPGDRVAVPAFTFVATANAVLIANATPVFVDVDPVTFCMDPEKLRAAMDPRVRAVLPVHLYGHPAPMQPIRDVAERAGATVVGDAAQAIGARYGSTPVGSTAALETFSFYPTKNVMTGEGGVVTTSDDARAELLRSLRNHGRGLATLGTYDHVRLGWNYRMTDLCAALGVVQMGRLAAFTEARRANAARLDRALSPLAGIVVPTEAPGTRHAFHQYTLRVPRGRESLRAHLRERGIGSAVYYPRPLHAYPHLERFAHGDLKVAERLCDEVLSLPVHPALSEEDLREIGDAVAEWTKLAPA